MSERVSTIKTTDELAHAARAEKLSLIHAEIKALENTITPRRIRDAILHDPEWLRGVEEKIDALRTKLV